MTRRTSRFLVVVWIFLQEICFAQEENIQNKREEELALARQILARSSKIAVEMNDKEERARLLSWVAVSQARVQDFAGALGASDQIEMMKEKSMALAEIAMIQGSLGDPGYKKTFALAIESTGSIKGIWHRAYAMSQIGRAQALAGDAASSAQTFVKALKLAGTLENDSEKASLLYRIAGAQLSLNHSEATTTFRLAGEIIGSLPKDHRSYIVALIHLPGQVNAGDPQGARNVADLFIDEGDEFPKSWLLSFVASEQAHLGDIEGALTTAAKIDSRVRKAAVLESIVRKMIAEEDLEGAKDMIKEMEDNQANKALALAHLANAYFELGDLDLAERIVGEALVAASKTAGSPEHDIVLLEVVKRLIQLEQLKQAHEISTEIAITYFRYSALTEVALAYANSGNRAVGMALLNQTLEASSDSKGIEVLVQGFARMGEIEKALAASRKLSGFDKESALQHTATIQAEKGDAEGALKWANELSPSNLQAYTLLGIALGIFERYGIVTYRTVY